MAFYKYIKLTDLEYFIKNKTIKFTNPLDFNDPFDCNFPYHDELFADVFERYMVENRKKMFPDHHEEISKFTAHFIKPTFDSIKDKLIKNFRELWDNQIPNYRILCLSTNNDNILMWSHYADYHQGAIVEIDINKLRLPTPTPKNRNMLMKGIIKYDKYHYHIKTIMDKTLNHLNNKLDKKAICQSFLDSLCEYLMYKMPEWEYENEYRMVISKNNDMLHIDDTISIDQGAVKRVILGCCAQKSKPKEYKNAISMLEEYDIPYSLAKKKSDRLYIPEA
ncbi:DUF2971 domain-containing protein [Yersinia proxima]